MQVVREFVIVTHKEFPKTCMNCKSSLTIPSQKVWMGSSLTSSRCVPHFVLVYIFLHAPTQIGIFFHTSNLHTCAKMVMTMMSNNWISMWLVWTLMLAKWKQDYVIVSSVNGSLRIKLNCEKLFLMHSQWQKIESKFNISHNLGLKIMNSPPLNLIH